MSMKKIGFLLKQENDWPPADIEHVWLEPEDNFYIVKNFPLFVKGIAFEDKISIELDENDYVINWKVIIPSDNSLIWIYEREPSDVLDRLHAIGCGVESGSFTKLAAVRMFLLLSMLAW